MTVRRDVASLSARNRLRQVFGGVTKPLNAPEALGTDYSVRLAANTAAKAAIGRRAAELVKDNSVIAIDSGSTALAVASHLGVKLSITVVTASLPVINLLGGRSQVELVALGGGLHRELQAFAGPLTLIAIEQLRVQDFFLGVSGVADNGIYAANQYDALTKRSLIDVAGRVILVADKSKFGSKRGMMRVADLNRADAAVVDEGVSDSVREYLQGAGVMLYEVNDKSSGTPAAPADEPGLDEERDQPTSGGDTARGHGTRAASSSNDNGTRWYALGREQGFAKGNYEGV
jgi:DeoR/GlpR family transcriptional regulator of sugar metabolism